MDYSSFSDIPVTTKTIIAITGWNLNIQELFANLPIVPYQIVHKKRGRKGKEPEIDPNANIAQGSIITLKHQHNIRGVEIKHVKKVKVKNTTRNYFRNALTIVMVLDKNINFKLSSNGKFQMTGCKTDKQAETCVKKIWEYICEFSTKGIKVCENFEELRKKGFEVIFFNGLRNIIFYLGFNVNRIELNNYINKNTRHKSFFEEDTGYPGVNIKFNIVEEDVKLNTMIYKNKKWRKGKKMYSEFYDSLSEEDKKKEEEKKAKKDGECNHFFVFEKGKVILSGKYLETMKTSYDKFKVIIEKARDKIENK